MLIQSSDYANLKQAGAINGQILAALRDALRPGMQTSELDEMALSLLRRAGAEPPFLGFPAGSEHPYPAVINVSVNEELVHGIPGNRVIQKGDVVTLDCGTNYGGMIADSAITVVVGDAPPAIHQLIHATEEALATAIRVARPGRRLGDVSFAIGYVLRKYQVNSPQRFGGHGVGYVLHGEPHVPNWGVPNRGMVLRPGMALAIEPMGMYGSAAVRLLEDHWTVVAVDGSICAHTEHTVLITEGGAEILTPVPN